jgi:hypothetical protein
VGCGGDRGLGREGGQLRRVEKRTAGAGRIGP